MNSKQWIIVAIGLVALAGLTVGIFWPKPKATPQPTPPPGKVAKAPQPKHITGRTKVNVDVHTSGGTRVKVGVDETTAAAPAPAAQAPSASVYPQPMSTPKSASECSETDNYYCGAVSKQPAPTVPPKPVPEGPDVSYAPKKSSGINILSGNSLSIGINILSSVGSVPANGFYLNGYGYNGSVMGHEEVVCEPYPTGCYRKWIGHRPPGTLPY